jgi:hypothetical protein
MGTKNNRKIYRLLVLVVSVLLPALVSCDRLGEGAGEGEKTAVHFSAGDLEPWGAEMELRGASDAPRLVETASVALEGNWVLKVDLMEEPVPPTRAYVNTGATVRVIALDASTRAVVAEKDYRHLSGANLEPVAGPMELEPGNYHFTAYSYNNITTVLPLTATSETAVTVSPYVDGTATNDLISGTTTGAKAVTTSGGVELPRLSHRFSRVQYSLNIPTGAPVVVNSVSLTNNYRATLAKSTALPARKTEYDVQSLSAAGHCIVYTGEENPRLSISVTVNGTNTFPRVSVSYRQPLTAGNSYTLRINVIQGLAWSASNIYWEENLFPDRPAGQQGGLTFKEYGDPCENGEDMYQGVFFRWGSLTGVDPSPGSVVIESGSTWDTDATTGNVLYVPVYDSDSPENSTWAVSTGGAWKIERMGATVIPSYDGPDIDFFGTRDPPFFYDICRYLSVTGAVSGSYRMPTVNELLSSNWHIMGGSWPALPLGITTPTDPTGKYTSLTTGGNYRGYVNFPAAGYRAGNSSNAVVREIGHSGRYWSSSGYSGQVYARHIFIVSSDVGAPSGGTDRATAFSVRCLLDE